MGPEINVSRFKHCSTLIPFLIIFGPILCAILGLKIAVEISGINSSIKAGPKLETVIQKRLSAFQNFEDDFKMAHVP